MTTGLAATTLANKWLDLLRGVAFTAPAAQYARLHTGDPGALGTANQAAGDTTRKAITFAAAAAGAMAQNGTAPSWTNGGTTETLRAVSVWDAATGGNFLYSFLASAEKAWGTGDTVVVSGVTFSLSPITA